MSHISIDSACYPNDPVRMTRLHCYANDLHDVRNVLHYVMLTIHVCLYVHTDNLYNDTWSSDLRYDKLNFSESMN